MINVVEETSTNVNILCGLDIPNNPPVYWIINQNMYAISNLPHIFKTAGYEALTLEDVNRRMTGWEFQCVRVNANKELIRGQMSRLTVYYSKCQPRRLGLF